MMYATVVLSAISICLLALVITISIYLGYKIRKYILNVVEDLTQQLRKYENEQITRFSNFNQKLLDYSNANKEEITLLKHELNKIQSNSTASFTAIYNKCNELAEQQKTDSVATSNQIQTIQQEQRAYLSKIGCTVIENFAKLETFMTEKVDNNFNTIVSSINKTEENISNNLNSILVCTSTNNDKLKDLIQLQFDKFKQVSNELKRDISKANAELSCHENKLDLLIDLNTMLSENLVSLKKETVKDFNQIFADLSNNQIYFQEKFSTFESYINLLIEESKSLNKELSTISSNQVQNKILQNKQIDELKNHFELQLASLLSTIQLLEINLQKTSLEKSPKTSTSKISENENICSKNKTPSKNQNIYAPNGDEIQFSQLADGKTISKTYRKGKLCFEILHSQWGVPEKGTMYSEDGKVLNVFEYDSNGQVK